MADIGTSAFLGEPFPRDVVRSILNVGLQGAPVFDSFTRMTTNRSSVAFPTSDPSGFDWVAELGEIPAADLGDDAAIVTPAKIAGRLLVSNEAVSDTEFPLASEIGRLIQGGLAAKADADLTYGSGPAPEPTGFLAALDSGSGATLRAAVVDAVAQILAAGGKPTHVILSPSLWQDEMDRREETEVAGGALFADLGMPLTVSVASTLQAGDGLVFDRSGCYGVVRNDASIEASRESADAWTHDAVSLRVKARLAVAIPAPGKAIRSLAVLSS